MVNTVVKLILLILISRDFTGHCLLYESWAAVRLFSEMGEMYE